MAQKVVVKSNNAVDRARTKSKLKSKLIEIWQSVDHQSVKLTKCLRLTIVKCRLTCTEQVVKVE